MIPFNIKENHTYKTYLFTNGKIQTCHIILKDGVINVLSNDGKTDMILFPESITANQIIEFISRILLFVYLIRIYTIF